MSINLVEMHYFPIKSCGRIKVTEPGKSLPIVEHGFKYDHEWAIINDRNQVINQREYPELELIQPSFEDGLLMVDLPRVDTLAIPMRDRDFALQIKEVKIGSSLITAKEQGGGDYVTEFMRMHKREGYFRLVRMNTGFNRTVSPRKADTCAQAAFQNQVPFTLGSKDIKDYIDTVRANLGLKKLPDSRYRVSLLVEGASLEEILSWKKVQIDNMVFEGVGELVQCRDTVYPYIGLLHQRAGQLTIGSSVKVLEENTKPSLRSV